MPRITSLAELDKLREEIQERRRRQAAGGSTLVAVGMGTCGIAAGALEVFRALEAEIQAHRLGNIVLIQTGCMGLCTHEPIVEVTVGDSPKVSYGHVHPEVVAQIVQDHILNGRVVQDFVIDTTPFPTI